MDVDCVASQDLSKDGHNVRQLAFPQNDRVIAVSTTGAAVGQKPDKRGRQASKQGVSSLFQEHQQEAVHMRQLLFILVHRQPLEPNRQDFVHVHKAAVVLQDLGHC